MTCISRAFEACGMAPPQWKVIDTLTIARSMLDLPNYRLPTICEYYDISIQHLHCATDDAEACALIAIAMCGDEPPVRMATPYIYHAKASNERSYKRLQKEKMLKMIELAQQAKSPDFLLAELRKARPEIAEEIQTAALKDGKQIAFKRNGAVIFYFVTGKSGYYIKISGIDNASQIAPAASQFKDGSWRLVLNNCFNTELFIQTAAELCDQRGNEASPVFGCCNDFIRCSDAKRCLKAGDPYYRRCEYRRNLEAGRIFYGINRNID